MSCSPRAAAPTAPAQTQSRVPCQAELVICDKTIERTFAWLNRFRRLVVRYERLAYSIWPSSISAVHSFCLRFLQRRF